MLLLIPFFILVMNFRELSVVHGSLVRSGRSLAFMRLEIAACAAKDARFDLQMQKAKRGYEWSGRVEVSSHSSYNSYP